MPDALDDVRSRIDRRLKELRPYLAEFERLQTARAALGDQPAAGVSSASNGRSGSRRRRSASTAARGSRATASRASATRTSGKRASSSRAASTTAKAKASTAPAAAKPAARGRQSAGGGRAAQALEVVVANPGISIPEIAKRVNANPNYLYRVLNQLQADRKVVKEGKGWKAK